jgi:hypothetical protein
MYYCTYYKPSTRNYNCTAPAALTMANMGPYTQSTRGFPTTCHRFRSPHLGYAFLDNTLRRSSQLLRFELPRCFELRTPLRVELEHLLVAGGLEFV